MIRKILMPAVVLSLAAFGAQANAQNTSFDESVTWGANGSSSWFVSSTTDAMIAPTGAGSPNPELSLEIGKRYRFVNTDNLFHPFAVMAGDNGGDPGSDGMLLIQGGSNPAFESNASVDWHDDAGANVYFNMSAELADAMNGSASQGPGYRCNVHTFAMRGDVSFRGLATGLAWPSGTEDFENAALGTSVDSAFVGWAIVTDDAVNYTATISDEPVGATNQNGASTRWLTINDAHDAAGVQDRVYSTALEPPMGENVDDYTWSFLVNIESLGTADVLMIVQHDDGGTFRNVGGLRVNASGVSATVLGTDDGGIGKAGASVNDALYGYGDAGGFAQGDWVPVSFTIDVNNGNIDAAATGTDGSTNVSASAAGLDLQGTADPNRFRLCIRNTGSGNTSVISYDNVSFTGNSSVSSVDSWSAY